MTFGKHDWPEVTSPRLDAREAEKIVGHRLDRRVNYWLHDGKVYIASWREGPPFGWRTASYCPVSIQPIDKGGVA